MIIEAAQKRASSGQDFTTRPGSGSSSIHAAPSSPFLPCLSHSTEGGCERVWEGLRSSVPLHPWPRAWSSHSGVAHVGFELLGCCSIWGFCGRSLFPNNHSGPEDADSETPGQLTSAFSPSSSPPALQPVLQGDCGCGLSSDGGGGRARAGTAGTTPSTSLWSFRL